MTNNDRFTGGDDLTGIFKKYHDIMMKNELNGGKGAYKLTWAGGKSGPSFGGNQMDLGQSKEAIEALRKLLPNARDNHGQLIFSKQESDTLKKTITLEKRESFIGKSQYQMFGNLVPKINQALSSEYGKQVVNKAYQNELADKATHIENIVRDIKHPGAKAFYQTTKGKVLLFDYHNQFNLEPNGLLAKYLNGEQVKMFGGKTLNIKDKGTFTLEDHTNFIFNTKYGVEKYADIERRFANINKYMDDELNMFASAESERDDTQDVSFAEWLKASHKMREISEIKEARLKELRDRIDEKSKMHNDLYEVQIKKANSDKFASLQASADQECAQKGEAMKASTACNEHNSYHSEKQCHVVVGGESCTTTYYCNIPVDCSDINAKYNQMYADYLLQLEQQMQDESKEFTEKLSAEYAQGKKDIQKMVLNLVDALIGDEFAKELANELNEMTVVL